MFRADIARVCLSVGLLWSAALSAEELFFPSETCGFCHSAGSGALVDSEGNDVSIVHDWSASLMANSLHDPLFQAKIATEIERNPGLKAAIEDKCLRCHAPMGRTQHYHDGLRDYGLKDTEGSELAYDGVSCALCHQIQDSDLDGKERFSGGYVIEGKREIYGPYRDVFTMPMRNHLDYTPMFGEQIGESSLCGTCHVLFTPIVDASGQIKGEFPEQTVYLEWLNSDYAQRGAEQQCQDCHLRRVKGAVKISRRPPWFDVKREPFKQHTFSGGNRLVLGMLRVLAEGMDKGGLAAGLQQAVERADETLKRASRIEVLEVELAQALRVKVGVENLTGHKLPTGYPSRRAWVRLTVLNADGTKLFQSGGWDPETGIAGMDTPYEPHHDVISREDQVQVYQSVMGTQQGEVTHTLLRAARYLKDNRIPPKGFRADGPWTEHTAVAGEACEDADFNRSATGEGTGRDLIDYRIPLEGAVYPLRVEAELLYQTVSRSFANDLFESQAEAVEIFKLLYERLSQPPVQLGHAMVPVTEESGS